LTIYHMPENEQMMDEIYAVLSIDEKGEGICSMMTPAGALPMVFGHQKTLNMLRPIIIRMAKETGEKLRLVKFTKSEILEEF